MIPAAGDVTVCFRCGGSGCGHCGGRGSLLWLGYGHSISEPLVSEAAPSPPQLERDGPRGEKPPKQGADL